MEEKLVVSIIEASRLLGISKGLCYAQVRSGQIFSIRLGRRLLIPRAALEKLLEQGQPINPDSKG